ncbi:MAG: hypothetical protein M4579_000412 [Chaenotheca gracillima]|nr:MAG: hypothetical protein M4579_000412 [Chaenotheca gracillima]
MYAAQPSVLGEERDSSTVPAKDGRPQSQHIDAQSEPFFGGGEDRRDGVLGQLPAKNSRDPSTGAAEIETNDEVQTPSTPSARLPPTRTSGSSRLLPLREHGPHDFNEVLAGGDISDTLMLDDNGDVAGDTRQAVDVKPSSSRTPSGSNSSPRPEANGPEHKHRRTSVSRESDTEKDKVLKLSPSRIQELTSSPDSLPLIAPPVSQPQSATLPESPRRRHGWTISEAVQSPSLSDDEDIGLGRPRRRHMGSSDSLYRGSGLGITSRKGADGKDDLDGPRSDRPLHPIRTVSTPPPMKRRGSQQKANGKSGQFLHTGKSSRAIPSPLQLDGNKPPSSRTPSAAKHPPSPDPAPSPMPTSIPLPPLSIPTYLQLELSASRPSPLYIHRSATSDFPYESSKVKFERLLNFLLLPPQLEAVLWFGALACADAWLYTFTILPLRFFKALSVLCQWWGSIVLREAKDIGSFIYWGSGRMWQRHTGDSVPPTPAPESPQPRRSSFSGRAEVLNGDASHSYFNNERKRARTSTRRHRRTKSAPSALLPNHKADLLKGLVVLFSCLILMKFDASRMYHAIRGQAAIKLYVIYNVLECCDRLFSALGQDVFECLFSRETLERNPDGRSKLLRPFGMFLLALSYNVIHSTALFYQVITLNVAVNSYSNALLTLLMSNQFVEIKSTVFKKFEKENLFQLTCADVVERFQLWLMLLIIALRNIVEVGGLSLSSFSTPIEVSGSAPGGNANASSFRGNPESSSILPKSFTIFPIWTGQVLGPFLLVLGSEMLVDWLKHAYITKFNNTKPSIYGRFLDVLAKDYYSNAFADQNLTRRLGLPVIPLSCLFIRAAIQTYHMLLATHLPLPIPSPSTSLSLDDPSGSSTASSSPAATAALAHLDTIIRRALGRSSFGAGTGSSSASSSPWWWFLPPFPRTTGDAIALLAMALFFLGIYLVMLATKLVLGMALLGFARGRYKDMKEREREIVDTGGRRLGGWGVVEVDDDKKRWIYLDDPEGGRRARERERIVRERGAEPKVGPAGGDSSEGGKAKATTGYDDTFGAVSRYTMVAKRIW